MSDVRPTGSVPFFQAAFTHVVSMRTSHTLLALFRFCLPPSIIALVYLYLYPAILGCSFPVARRAEAACSVLGKEKAGAPAEIAPFRLLALGDPQLEGDTSLPDANKPLFPSVEGLAEDVQHGGLTTLIHGLIPAAKALVSDDVPRIVRGFQKRLDLWGNDLYLAHIYRSASWWTQPTHTVVLGDLLGSQWIGDEEFRRRSERFWKRIFKDGEMVPSSISESSSVMEFLGRDESWQRRIITVAGNHDIGYAGDINAHRIARFEEIFGPVNWQISFYLPQSYEENRAHPAVVDPDRTLRLVVLNSMNLDGPAYDQSLRDQSIGYLRHEIVNKTSRFTQGGATILLTHIPLHKPSGVCVDGPFFDYFSQHEGGGIKEQNHLSEEISEQILSGLAQRTLARAKPGGAIVLNGHDHEGCDTYHYRSRSNRQAGTEPWEARPYHFARALFSDPDITGLREVTVRSMMGSFGGNAGMLSAWYDEDSRDWKFDYATCALGVQHIWWAIHVLAMIEVLLGIGGVGALLFEEFWPQKLAEPRSSTGAPKRPQ